MKKTINAVVSIEYNYDEGQFSERPDDETAETAIHLAMEPNFNSIESGVSLRCIKLSRVDPEKLIDWNRLAYSPDMLFVNRDCEDIQSLVERYAHCGIYRVGTEEYRELDALTEQHFDEVQSKLSDLGYILSYNMLDNCYCVH